MLATLNTIVDAVGMLGALGASWLYHGLHNEQHRDTRVVMLAIGVAFGLRIACDVVDGPWCSQWVGTGFRALVAGSLLALVARRMFWWQGRGVRR